MDPEPTRQPAPRHDAVHSQALLNAILESLPFRVWACDTEGRCVLQNSVSIRDFGEFIGHKAEELPLPAEQIARWRSSVERALAGEVVTHETEIPWNSESRTYRYVIAPIREGAATLGVVGVDIDITDQRRTETALTISEERLRSVTENAPDIIIQVDRDRTITYINQVFPPFHIDQVIGSNVDQWIPPSYRPIVRKEIEDVFDHAQPGRYETEGIGRNGELAWYSTRISPVVIDGEVASAILICSDMTERQRSETALRESEERFRQLASSIAEGFWLIGLNPERLLYINTAFERIWGVPAAELYNTVRGGETWIHPEHRGRVHEIFDDWLAGLCDSFDVEYRIVRPDGSTRWVHDHGARIYDENGKFYRASGIVRDITERKLAEQALRESEARYRLLADHSSDLITRHALNGQWLYLSPASKTLTGYAPDDLIGQDPFGYIHPDDRDRCRALLAETVKTGRGTAATYRVRRVDGQYIWFESQARAVLDRRTGEVMEVITTSRDVTERIDAYRQLRQREADLAHTERLSTMGEMAAELAHELNQPLYAIANFAEASLGRLNQHAGEWTEPQDLRRWVEQIAQQARRAGEILRRMTQFVRKGELDPERLDLNALIGDVAVLLEFGIRSQGTHVEYDLAQPLPQVVADRLLIEQVLVNLVRNAADAMDETPPDRRRLIVRSFRAADDMVGIAVIDSGRGLPPGQADRLFESYFTTKPNGTGMGLAICRSTIAAHHGQIWAENNPTGGATFQFVLPVASRDFPQSTANESL
ncbi:MAG: PAS domain S-box protein [Pirellulaceae bacterium]|nr:PAS domain S-box protein [Pirellulaceae bacterium]